MTEYYFDIETAHKDPKDPNERGSLDPGTGKIITIQHQQLDSRTGAPTGTLNIWKEWDPGGEAFIVSRIFSLLRAEDPWEFIPVGKNLLFDFNFLNEKFKGHLNKSFDINYIARKPFIDVKQTLIMMNGGSFKGWDLQFGARESKGDQVPMWYREGKYKEIENYVKEEAATFITKYQELKRELYKIEIWRK